MTVLAGPQSFCSVCLEPACAHVGVPRFLEPMVYDRTPDGYWAVPARERALWDAATVTDRAVILTQPARDPFKCAACNGPLSGWARDRGYTTCSVACRESLS